MLICQYCKNSKYLLLEDTYMGRNNILFLIGQLLYHLKAKIKPSDWEKELVVPALNFCRWAQICWNNFIIDHKSAVLPSFSLCSKHHSSCRSATDLIRAGEVAGCLAWRHLANKNPVYPSDTPTRKSSGIILLSHLCLMLQPSKFQKLLLKRGGGDGRQMLLS